MNHKEYIIPIGEEAMECDEMFIGVIRKQPELIRCKDCQFYQTDKGGWCLDHDDDVLWLDDSYCSRAVRKEKWTG